MLEIKELSFAYDKKEKKALENISFSLEGGIGVLLGPNGSGKSTLLKAICGVTKIDKGHIYYQGEDLFALKGRERAKKISYVPQKCSVSGMTVYDAVMMGRIPYIGFRAEAEDREKVEEILKEMSLEEIAMRNVSDLSGGQQQKVLIARALVQESSLLLFDELTASLDIASSILVLNQIQEMVEKRKLSCLISMHDINLALKVADRFFLLKEGSLLGEGTKEILTSENVEKLYGIRGEVREVEGKEVFIYGEK